MTWMICLLSCSDPAPVAPPAVEVPAAWQDLGLPGDRGVPIRASDDALEVWLDALPEGGGLHEEQILGWVDTIVEAHGLVRRPPAADSTLASPLARYTGEHDQLELSLRSGVDRGTWVLQFARSDRPAAHPVSSPGPLFALSLQPGMDRLAAGELACVHTDGTAHVFYPDGHLEAHGSNKVDVLRWEAKGSGFRVTHPDGTADNLDPLPCLDARWADGGDSGAALLCAHRRWDCGLGMSPEPTVYVRDGGAGEPALALVAGVLSAALAHPPAQAPVFPADGAAAGTGVVVRVGTPPGSEQPDPRLLHRARALAEALDRDLRLDGLQVIPWKESPAPLVVDVGGTVAKRSP